MKIITPLYGGQVSLVFDDSKHTYTIDDKKISSVTNILSVIGKPQLIFWAVNEAISYLEKNLLSDSSYAPDELAKIFEGAKKAHLVKKGETADIGSSVHYWIKEYVAGRKQSRPDSPEANLAIDNFLKWETDHHVEFLQSECPIFSKEFCYSGTLDMLAKVDGKRTLKEIKTTSQIYIEHFLQLAAYGHAYMEEHAKDEPIENVGVIRIGRDGSFEVRDLDNWEDNFEVFLAVKKLYEWQQQQKN